MAWSPAGDQIASCSFDMTAHLWSPSLPQHQLIYAEHDDGLRSLSWSPNGKHIASAGDDYLMKVWDIQTGATLFTYTGHAKNRAGNIVCVAWSPDGNFLASAGDDVTVQICDAQYGHRLSTHIQAILEVSGCGLFPGPLLVST